MEGKSNVIIVEGNAAVETGVDALYNVLLAAEGAAMTARKPIYVLHSMARPDDPFSWAVSEADVTNKLRIMALPQGGFIWQLAERPAIRAEFDRPLQGLMGMDGQLRKAAVAAVTVGRDSYVYGVFAHRKNLWYQRAWLHFWAAPADDPYIRITPQGVATFEIDTDEPEPFLCHFCKRQATDTELIFAGLTDLQPETIRVCEDPICMRKATEYIAGEGEYRARQEAPLVLPQQESEESDV